MIYSYNGILTTWQIKRIAGVGEFHSQGEKQKKPNPKGNMLYDSIHLQFKDKQKSSLVTGAKQCSFVAREGLTGNRCESTSRGLGTLYLALSVVICDIDKSIGRNRCGHSFC